MIVRPWRKGDNDFELQDRQAYLKLAQDPATLDLSALSAEGLAWTGEVDGKIVGVAGVIPQWSNRAIAWAMIAKDAGPHFVSIHREVRKFLIHCPFVRVEAQVDVGFPEANRWMTMLGFELEGYMRAFRPDGADMLLYARVRR